MKTEREYMRIGFAQQRFNKSPHLEITHIHYIEDLEYEDKKEYHPLYGFCDAIVGLWYNKVFIGEVKKVREKLGLPEDGLDYFQSKKIKIKEDVLDAEIERILQEYAMTVYLKRTDSTSSKNYYSFPLRNIILYNFVIDLQEHENIIYIPYSVPEGTDDNSYAEEMEAPGLILKIHKPVTKHKFFKFIRDNWDKLEKDMQGLSLNMVVRKGRLLSVENFKLLELIHREKLSYQKAADELIKIFPDMWDKYAFAERELIKQRYKRAIRKINKLFYKK
jgi:hypothetical protein